MTKINLHFINKSDASKEYEYDVITLTEGDEDYAKIMKVISVRTKEAYQLISWNHHILVVDAMYDYEDGEYFIYGDVNCLEVLQPAFIK